MYHPFIVRFFKTHDCLFYLNDYNFKRVTEASHEKSVLVKYGREGTQDRTFGYLTTKGSCNLSNFEIGIDKDYGRILGLEDAQEIRIRSFSVQHVTRVFVSFPTTQDEIIFRENFIELQDIVLNQLKLVIRKSKVILHIQGKTILLKIESLEPDIECGELIPKSEILVFEPVHKQSDCSRRNKKENSDGLGILTQLKDWGLVKLTGAIGFIAKPNVESESEPEFVEGENQEVLLNVKPFFTVKDPGEMVLMDHSLNMMKGEGIWEIKSPGREENIISIDKITWCDIGRSNIYCCSQIMKRLNLKVGSKVLARFIKGGVPDSLVTESKQENEASPCVMEDFEFAHTKILREQITDIIRDNIIFGHRFNSVVVGGEGSGKSHVIRLIRDFCVNNFVNSTTLKCKSLRKKKISKIMEEFSEKLWKCCEFSPSVLLLDDLDALLLEEEEGNRSKGPYSERLSKSIVALFANNRRLESVTVIATVCSLSRLQKMSTARGPLLFENILEIPELSEEDRCLLFEQVLENSSSRKSYAEAFAWKTKGYTIRDLLNLVKTANLITNIGASRGKEPVKLCHLEKAVMVRKPSRLSGFEGNENRRSSSWEEIGGMEEAKKALIETFSWPLSHPDIFSQSPLRQQTGILLFGPPGTGKTLLAAAVADRLALNFACIKGPEIFSKYVGGSEEGIRNLFDKARNARPCILFFDEFDSLAPRRGTDNGGVNDRVVNQLLTELDGVESLSGVFLLAATSRPDLLDPALLRPGRIDKMVRCHLPDETERLQILIKLAKKAERNANDLEDIAAATDGYTGADLLALFKTAFSMELKECRHSKTNSTVKTHFELSKENLWKAVSVTKPSLSKMEVEKFKRIYEDFLSSRTGNDSRGPNTQFA